MLVVVNFRIFTENEKIGNREEKTDKNVMICAEQTSMRTNHLFIDFTKFINLSLRKKRKNFALVFVFISGKKKNSLTTKRAEVKKVHPLQINYTHSQNSWIHRNKNSRNLKR